MRHLLWGIIGNLALVAASPAVAGAPDQDQLRNWFIIHAPSPDKARDPRHSALSHIQFIGDGRVMIVWSEIDDEGNVEADAWREFISYSTNDTAVPVLGHIGWSRSSNIDKRT